ncbi:tissue factor pathway inhibitor-like [Ostrinia furnacalis]|uniref:tissue factor pathway inhibitor-like n=1 Tax=Ostrinia furnacalis TaxID=93504 RepID=UPI00103CED16|nr:tissue factor pathway inhibitor-like [Ostrinia furnacalis]
MELGFLCLLYLQCLGVLGRKEYNTQSEPTEAVSTIHTPTVLLKTCLLKPDQGPCRGNIRMYHYDPEKKNCSTFRWGGCQGNGNRFDKRSQCINTCLSNANMTKDIYRPRYCSLTFDYGFCFGAVKRYYFDRFWKVCKEALYSGCGGNKNNFYDFDQCDSICRLGKPRSEYLRTPKKKESADGVKKYLYINPPQATKKRGLLQITTKTTTTTTKPSTKSTRKTTAPLKMCISGSGGETHCFEE